MQLFSIVLQLRFEPRRVLLNIILDFSQLVQLLLRLVLMRQHLKLIISFLRLQDRLQTLLLRFNAVNHSFKVSHSFQIDRLLIRHFKHLMVLLVRIPVRHDLSLLVKQLLGQASCCLHLLRLLLAESPCEISMRVLIHIFQVI